MIANLHQSATAAFYSTHETKTAKPSTYKERVAADRILMMMMLVATIIVAIMGT